MRQLFRAGPGSDDDESGGNDENADVQPESPFGLAPVAFFVANQQLNEIGQNDGESRAQSRTEKLDEMTHVGKPIGMVEIITTRNE